MHRIRLLLLTERGWGGKPGRATMGIYSRNGTVFNAATTEWINGIGSDPVVRQISRNVFNRLKRRVPWDWEDIGHANAGSALASLEGKLFISTTDNKLWRRYPVGAEIVWRHIGHANDVVAMAGIEDLLFCVTRDNQLWYREPVEVDTNWTAAGRGPGTQTKALGAAGGMLYAVDTSGAMWRTPAKRTVPEWSPMNYVLDPKINAMTSYSDILIASTTDNRLLRSNRDLLARVTTGHGFTIATFQLVSLSLTGCFSLPRGRIVCGRSISPASGNREVLPFV